MYAVEGTIGVGKSFFIHLLADQLSHLSVALEPIYAWQRTALGQQLVEKFYTNPERWSYTLETYMITCRVKEHTVEQKRNLPFRLIERSIFSGHHVFAKTDYAKKKISPVEWSIYNEWFTFLTQTKCQPPLGFIYLKTNPKNAFERVKARNRASEKAITQDYLADICTAYDNFLIKKENVPKKLAKVPVLTLDFSIDLQNDTEIMQNYVTQVQNFITRTQPYKPALRLANLPILHQQSLNSTHSI